MILLLDNYDSFVHNIARYLRIAGKTTRVIRSDAVTAAHCAEMQPEAIVLSPGPHRPEQAGCCLDVVQRLAGKIPILGICLGHQAIASAYGAEILVNSPAHAAASLIEHRNHGIFAGLPLPMTVGRYHSLCVDAASLPHSLEVTAWTLPGSSIPSEKDSDRIVMGISDHDRCVHGVQFHPESLLTEHGQELIENFFALVDRYHRRRAQDRVSHLAARRPVAWVSPHQADRLTRERE